MNVEYIQNAVEITGHKVRVWKREAFTVVGYTAIIGPQCDQMDFYRGMVADGRLEMLIKASSVEPWVLGLGSWDPEVQGKGDYRHTACIEETEYTDFSALEREYPQYPLFRKVIGASEWMCFEDWRHDKNAYQLIAKLGYRFNNSDYDVGLHFDAWAPGRFTFPADTMEFWITVVKP